MKLHWYDDRLTAGEDELLTQIGFWVHDYGDGEGESVTIPLGRLEEILFIAGFTRSTK